MADNPSQALSAAQDSINSINRVLQKYRGDDSRINIIDTFLDNQLRSVTAANTMVREIDTNVDQLIQSYRQLNQERETLQERIRVLQGQLTDAPTRDEHDRITGQIRQISTFITQIDDNMTVILSKLQQMQTTNAIGRLNTDLQQINQRINTALPPAAPASGGNKYTRKKRKYHKKNYKKGGSKKMTGGSSWACECKQVSLPIAEPVVATGTAKSGVATGTAEPADPLLEPLIASEAPKPASGGGKKTKRRHRNIKSKSPIKTRINIHKKKHTNFPIIF